MYHHLVQIAMVDIIFAELYLPHAIVEGLELVFEFFLPSREITYEHNLVGIRSPFAEHPSVGSAVHPEILMRVSEIIERVGLLSEVGLLADGIEMTAFDSLGKGFEPGVVAQYREQFFSRLPFRRS